jgi:hypothetical protein
MILREFSRRRMTADLSHFVADAIDHRLTEIALHRPDVSRLEQFEAFHEIERRVLNQVVGVEAAARRSRQPAVRPALKLRQAPLEERLGRHPIAFARPDDQLHRWLIAK